MAFVSRIGNILKQAGSKHINIQSPGSNLSLYQAIRCMSSSKLFVGGISWNTDEQSLREVFAKYGEVVEARIIMDRESGRSRGFGFVSFTSTEEASSAIQALDNQVLHGRTIKVNFAIDKPRGGFGGGGNYGVGGGTYGGNYGGGNYGGNYQGGGGNYGGNYQGGGGSYGGNFQGGIGGSNGGDYQGGGGSYEGTGNDYAGGNGNYSSGGVSSFDGGNSGNYVGGDGDNYFSGGGAGSDSGFTGAGGDSGFTGAGGDSGFTDAGYSSTTGTGGGDESFARDPLEVSTRDDFDEPDDVSNTKG